MARKHHKPEKTIAKLDVSERFACWVLAQHRSMQRKAAGAADDEAAWCRERAPASSFGSPFRPDKSPAAG